MTPADSPENKCPTVECPDCGGMGSGEGGFRGGKKWKAICPGCGGSGRINTSAEEARNQGDFLGDDLSGEHSCHAGCPCHSGPEVHINAPEELSDEDKRIVGDLVNRAAEKMQPDPQCPETQTEAKPESLEEESPAAVPVDGEARIPDPGLTREEATSIGPGFGPITEATPCACGAIQPCHYCPVNASARAKLRASLAAADKGENDG